MSRPFSSLMDLVANACGYVPKDSEVEDVLFRGAYWFVSAGGGPEVAMGKNILTKKMRANAAGLLARTALHSGVPYTGGDEGWLASDPAFPTQLAIGQGTTAAQDTDWTMYDPLLIGGATKYYPLARILYHRNPASYSPPALPISVSYFFDIPAGEVYDVVGTDVDIQEWALFGPAAPAGTLALPTDAVIDQDMLARKVARLSKISALDLTVRWELRT